MNGARILVTLCAALIVACEDGTAPDLAELEVSDAVLAARGDTLRLSAWSDGALVSAEWRTLDSSVVAVTPEGRATAVAPGTARVVASFRGVQAEGRVGVLPAVDVRILDLAPVTDPSGVPGVRMRLRNLGGRGFYRLELWTLEPDGSRRRIFRHDVEMPVEPGWDIEYTNYLLDETPDWAVAYSREPIGIESVRTACVRTDGAPGCPGDHPGPPAVHRVHVTPAAGVLAVGDSLLFEARVYDAGGVEIPGRPVVWHTPSPEVVRVDERGMVTALTRGYGQVEASADGVSGAVGITVAEAVSGVDSVRAGPASRTQVVGHTVRYTTRAFGRSGSGIPDPPMDPEPSFSPDGRTIVFPRSGPDHPHRPVVTDLAGNLERRGWSEERARGSAFDASWSGPDPFTEIHPNVEST